MARARKDATFFHRNGLSIVFLALTVLSLVGHALSGWHARNDERGSHGLAAQPLSTYLQDGHFTSSLFENWESEFLQMGLFVLLTVALRQRGSSESRPLDPAEEKHEKFPKASQPGPVRKGGIVLRLYEHSLSIALFALFAASFVAHWISSWTHQRDEQLLHGEQVTPLLEYLCDAQFWFESFQNWQSEFLAVVALVLLSIWLREKDSPQSKPVEAPHWHTGA